MYKSMHICTYILKNKTIYLCVNIIRPYTPKFINRHKHIFKYNLCNSNWLLVFFMKREKSNDLWVRMSVIVFWSRFKKGISGSKTTLCLLWFQHFVRNPLIKIFFMTGCLEVSNLNILFVSNCICPHWHWF